VLGINAMMFVAELIMGVLSGSTAVLSDSLDNLGDALTYGLSLYVVSKDTRSKAMVALFKGALIMTAGIAVLGQVLYRIASAPTVPIFEVMGVISVLALAANSACLALLWKHREEDVNMSSVWACSRNDIASNFAVLVASAGVWLTQAAWPDLVVGAVLACLLLMSSSRVLRSAIFELRNSRGDFSSGPRKIEATGVAPYIQDR
jgi:Co/Zn/Cd efflux system component